MGNLILPKSQNTIRVGGSTALKSAYIASEELISLLMDGTDYTP